MGRFMSSGSIIGFSGVPDTVVLSDIIRNFLVYYRIVRYDRSSIGARNYLRHCIVGKIQDDTNLSKAKQYISIILDIVEANS